MSQSIVRRRRVTAASLTPAKLSDFLRHLEDSGSVSAAAARTGIARNTVYLRRKADPEFALGGDNRLLMFLPRTLRDSCSKKQIAPRQFAADGEFIDTRVSFYSSRKGPVCRRFPGGAD